MELLRFQNSFYSFNLLSLIKLESQRFEFPVELCVCACLCTRAHSHACGGQRWILGAFLRCPLFPYPLPPRQAPSLSLELPDWSVWPVSSRDSCPCVLSTSIRGVFYYHLAFYTRSRRSGLRPQACVPTDCPHPS